MKAGQKPSMFADKEQQKARQDICRTCPHRMPLPVVTASICRRCGCPIASKTMLATSSCPEGRW